MSLKDEIKQALREIAAEDAEAERLEHAKRNLRTLETKNPDGSVTRTTYDLSDSGGPL